MVSGVQLIVLVQALLMLELSVDSLDTTYMVRLCMEVRKDI